MSELVKLNASDYGLEETKAKEISEFFKPMLDTMESFEYEFNDIVKLEINDETCAKAKELRNRYVKVRTGTSKIHKELKQFYLQGGRFVDGFKNAQLMASNGKEEKLMSIEKHFENIEKERLENLQEERVSELSKYLEDAEERILCDMDKEVWNAYISTKKKDYLDKIEAEKEAEKERLEKERLEKEAIEKQRIENEKLKKEAEAIELLIEKERKENEAILKQERLKAEKEAKRLKDIADAKLKKELEAKAKIELELKRKQIAEAEAKKEKESAELKAKKEAEKLAKAPIKKQLNIWVDTFELPHLRTDNDKAVEIKKRFESFKKWAKTEIETI